jgi:hypothetical protein
MTKKFHIQTTFRLFIILTLGIFLTPTQSYACGTHSAKAEKSCEESPCCKKEKSNKTEKKDCCKKSKSQTKQSEKKKDCEGKCGENSCHCPTFNFAFTLPFVAELTNNNFEIFGKKQKFYDKKAHLSSGFVSIWTPPNIS